MSSITNIGIRAICLHHPGNRDTLLHIYNQCSLKILIHLRILYKFMLAYIHLYFFKIQLAKWSPYQFLISIFCNHVHDIILIDKVTIVMVVDVDINLGNDLAILLLPNKTNGRQKDQWQ